MGTRSLGDWLAWQETLHPSAIDLGLERVARVWQAIGAPRPAPRVITVAGTNGKGSSVALLERIFIEAGYRTGAYTSPHLLRYNERVRIDGIAVSDEAFCEAFTRIDAARGDTSLTYFEFGTLAAFDILARAGVDVALLEVGMGGRLDATNIIDADLALITNIGLDHTQWLGDTLAAIAAEKAGILRPHRPVVLAAAQLPGVIADRARELDCPLYQRGESFAPEPKADGKGWSWRGPRGRLPNLPLPALPGDHQLDNAAAVLMVLDSLRDCLPVSDTAIRRALAGLTLPGRMTWLTAPVPTLLDVAHNADGVRVLQKYLQQQPGSGVTRAVAGFMADKDLGAMIAPLRPLIHRWYLTPLPQPRSADPQRLRQLADASGIDALVCGDVAEAWRRAVTDSDAAAGDRVLVFGSFLTVAGVLSCISETPGLE